jgi:sugar O-acyltransferase (sialic acid O-acetyltransferase NeuD family)
MENIKIGLIGYGAVGKFLHTMLKEDNYKAEQIYIFDDVLDFNPEKYIFKFNDYKSENFKDLHFIPTLGYLSQKLKRNILDFLTENNYNIFSYIHPSCYVSSSAKIGKGVTIYSMCNIDHGVIIDDGVIIANSTLIAHDAFVGKCTYIAAMVCVCGCVNIGEMCFIGSSASIANGLTIGKNTTIAIGTCITKSIAEGSFAIGNPFVLKNNIKLQ